MTKGQAWLKALRLRTLPLSLSGIVLGALIAWSRGFYDGLILSFALCTTILFQILSNLANDLGDSQKGADNANRVGPMRAVQSGVISQKEMKVAVGFVSVLSALSALILIYFGTKGMDQYVLNFYSFLALACIVAAITYTMGKRAYGYSGFGDVFVFIFFGFVSVMGVYTLFSKELDWVNLFPAAAIGFFSTAVLNLNNMRDIENDAKVGKITLVVKMGANKALVYHSILVVSGILSLLTFHLLQSSLLGLFGLIPCLILLLHLKKAWSFSSPKEFDPELKKVALGTFLIALINGILIGL
jgi:1,4-dihydroxy-2-naphthoate polyprenyltransferase